MSFTARILLLGSGELGREFAISASISVRIASTSGTT